MSKASLIVELKKDFKVDQIDSDAAATAIGTSVFEETIEDHTHSELVASDGSPDPALQVGETGFIGIGLAASTQLDVLSDQADSRVANFFNDGNNVNRFGIKIQCGMDTPDVNQNYPLSVYDGNGTIAGYLQFNNAAFSLVDSISDKRLKKNITETKMNATNIIKNLELKDFEWIDDNKSGIFTNFIAQDAELVLPELVSDSTEVMIDDTPIKSIAITNLIRINFKAIQEQQTIIEDLISRIESLEAAK